MNVLEKKVVSQCISSDYCAGWNDAVDAMPRWNNVADKLPFYNTTVLCIQSSSLQSMKRN